MQVRQQSHTERTLTFESLARQVQLAKQVQRHLVRMGLLDPPANGKFGPFSSTALKNFQTLMKISESGLGPKTQKAVSEVKEAVPLKLGNDFASRIIKYMRSKQYYVAVLEKHYNIVYLEGANGDGTPNTDEFNKWNDRRMVIEIQNGVPRIVGNWVATTEPGDFYTYFPMNRKGAARIAFGQYFAWRVGLHNGEHEALVQEKPVKVHRDLNQDGFRTGDAIDEGLFGINQHWGYDLPVVGKASAGCLVGQSRNSHRDFMRLIKQDKRYQLNSGYLFCTTIIPGDDFAKTFPAM